MGHCRIHDFPVIYDTDEPFEILLPHLAVVKRYAQVLQLRAIAELQNGQGDKALADVKLMLRLTGFGPHRTIFNFAEGSCGWRL